MSWRKYGSIKNQETNNNITTNNIVAENLLFRNPNSSITFQTDLTITGNAHVNKNLEVDGTITMGGNPVGVGRTGPTGPLGPTGPQGVAGNAKLS